MKTPTIRTGSIKVGDEITRNLPAKYRGPFRKVTAIENQGNNHYYVFFADGDSRRCTGATTWIVK